MSDEEFPTARFFKLRNGDDVVTEVAEVYEGGDFYYTFISPLKVMYIPSSGMLSIAFAPWVYPRIVDVQEFVVRDEEIVASADVSKDMNDFYWKNRDSYLARQTEDELKEIVEEEEDDIDADELQAILDSMREGKTFH